MRTTAIAFLLAAVLGACSKPNPDHCANQDGHATCKDRGGDTRYCSRCVADNDGCVAQPVTDECDAGSTSEPGSTSDPTTAGDSSTSSTTSSTTGSSTSSSTSDPTTGSSTSTTADDPSTTTSTGTTSDTSTGTTEYASTGTTSDTSTGTTESLDTDTDTDATGTSGSTGASTGDTEPPGPMCGDGMKDPGETCDGTDLGGLQLCVEKNMTKYGGGVLSCADNCNSYDEDKCCIATGQACPTFPQKCCKYPNALCLGSCG